MTIRKITAISSHEQINTLGLWSKDRELLANIPF